MTAFSRADILKDDFQVDIEIRSYNSRHLDISLKLPHGCASLENRIKSFLSEHVARGRIETRIQVKDQSEDAYAYEINTAKAGAYHNALKQMADLLKLDKAAITTDILVNAGVIQAASSETDDAVLWPVVKACLEKVTTDLDAMRTKEGDHIATDFEDRLEFIEKNLKKIKDESAGLPQIYKERLMDRIATLTGGVVEIDPARIAQEAAILADKSDISEEIVRANSHLAQFREIMHGDEPAGRKLNFLLQEFNREFNTMGSKTGKADVSHLIVSVKSELEKIREQVQNIE